MSSLSSCSSKRSTESADNAAQESPRDYMNDVSSATDMETNQPSSDKGIIAFEADGALKSDAVDRDEEVGGVPDDEATQKQVVPEKLTLRAESSNSLGEATERTPSRGKEAPVVQSSIAVEDWDTSTSFEAQGASSQQIEVFQKESNVVKDASSNHSSDKRKIMEMDFPWLQKMASTDM